MQVIALTAGIGNYAPLSLRMNGTIDPQGADDVTWYISWGPGESFEYQTPTQPLPVTGRTPEPVFWDSYPAVLVQPDVLYTFYIVAISDGVSYESNQQNCTLTLPPGLGAVYKGPSSQLLAKLVKHKRPFL